MKHLDVAAAVVLKDGKILAMQRGPGGNPATACKWEFPGGKMEPGETPQQALARELKEELAIDVSVGEFICTVD